jgi:sec-independent protein translocase protein TatA
MLHTITLSFSTLPLALGMPSGFEWLIIMGFGLLIFGKRLPEVGRSLGKGIVEFKKGLKGVEDEISQVDEQPATQPRMQATLPGETKVQQFDPYTGKPIAPSTTEQHSTHV